MSQRIGACPRTSRHARKSLSRAQLPMFVPVAYRMLFMSYRSTAPRSLCSSSASARARRCSLRRGNETRFSQSVDMNVPREATGVRSRATSLGCQGWALMVDMGLPSSSGVPG